MDRFDWDNLSFVENYIYSHITPVIWNEPYTPAEIRAVMLERWWTAEDLDILDGYVAEYLAVRERKFAAMGEDWDWPTVRHCNQRKHEIMEETGIVLQRRINERHAKKRAEQLPLFGAG